MSALAALAPGRLGDGTLALSNPPRFLSAFTLAGSHEAGGRLAPYLDGFVDDDMMGQATPEKAERQFMIQAAHRALARAGLQASDIDLFIAGDLLNQLVSATMTARDLGIPHLGVFAACATSAQAMGLAALLIDGGYARRVMVGASSHYQSVERQFRYPIELNIQRKSTNHWTATGAGVAILGAEGSGPKITHVTFGKVIDYGLSDPNDMGSIMAPAALDTLLRHFQNTGTDAGDYDLILTGDLGKVGKKMLKVLLRQSGIALGNKHQDCGDLMYGPQQTFAHAGASGTACSMMGILGFALKQLQSGRYRRILALPTGCLHSPVLVQQGDSCPAICHAIVLEN